MAAVLDKDRVIACSPAAYRLGVRKGMRRNTASGLAMGIRLVQNDPVACRKRLQDIALALLQYTPELALFDSRSIMMDVSASLALFKGPRQLYRRVQTTLTLTGAQAHVGMAPTALGAWLLARQPQKNQRRILRKSGLARLLDPLPPRLLPAARPYLDWLNGLGCTTLQQLVQLPRSGLIQRTSPQLGRQLDAAYGKARLHLDWYHPPDVFQASCTLDFHTLYLHAVLTAARRLIEQLCGWLQARQWAASVLEFSLHHEKGRHACPPTRITLRLSDPDWQADVFLSLLAEQLQHQRLQAPVIAIDLHDVAGQPRSSQAGSLFPDPAQYQRQENQLIDLLCARLGDQHVLQPKSAASHLPEHANQWIPVNQPLTAEKNSDSSGLVARNRPFWLLGHAVELLTRNDRPLYQGHVLRLTQGPERLESGWWMDGQHEQRDYFIATDAAQCRYWIYRQRGSDNPRWFLHGLFA